MPTGSETLQILPAPEKDRHGDPVGDPPAAVEALGCITWPRRSLESGRGWVTVDGLSAFIPEGQPIPAAEDQVTARGETWDVDGRPAEYLGKGTIVELKKRST